MEPDPAKEYRSIGIRSFGRGIFHYEPKPGNQLGSLRFFELRPERLVISNIKGWEGAIAVSGPLDAGTVASNRFLIYLPIDDQIDVRWARWYFLSEAGIAQIQRASPGSADRNRTLAIERFEGLEIPLPPIDEQRRVAARLDRTAAATDAAMLLRQKAGVLAGALEVSVASRPDLPASAKESAGWARTCLRELLTPATESTPVEASKSYPNIGLYSFGRGVFEKPEIDGALTSAKTLFRIRSGQFIYSRLFAFEGAYSCVPSRFDGYFVSNEFPVFDADVDRLDTRWLATYLRSPSRWAELGGASKGIGVRRQRVPVEAVLGHEVWLPPIAVQLDMVELVEKLAQASRSRAIAGERMKALSTAALNEAFSRSG